MSLADEVALRRESTAEKLAGALRERILSGQLPAGSPLREEDVAKTASVSRHTARAAIRVLVASGLVRHTAHKGAEVATMTASDVRELYQLRRLIEPAAIDVPARLDDTVLAPLEAALDRLERVAALANEDLVEADLAFHGALVGLAGNERLDRFYAQTLRELRLAFVIVAVADDERRDAERLIDQHAELLELLRAGRRKECKRALLTHIDRYEDRLLDLLSARVERGVA
jgi:DNA-binding GntR family transcriptional regulator